MKIIITNFILCFIFLTSALLAADYYVSPSGSNTTGNGTIGNPWQTIGYALNNIFPGDILYLRGGNYNEQVTTVRSGEANNYITISSYNNENAVIDGTGLTWNNGIILEHSYIKLTGFTSKSWGSTGIWIRDCQFVQLSKINITDVIGGISVTGTVHDFLIDNCNIYEFYGGAGGLGFDATPGEGDSIYNGTISNSKAYITAGGFDNCDGFALGHDGISNIHIYNCEVFGVGDGFDVSGRDIILERCSAHDCTYGGGFKLWRDSITLINCIAFNNRTNLELDFDQATQKGVKARLINCTFWGGPSLEGSNIFVEYSELGSKLEMYNCIIGGSNNTGLTFGDTDSANCYRGNYNIFHGNNTFRVISGSTFDYSSTQIQNGEWTAFSGQDANSRVVFDGSTLLIDTLATNPDLHLKAGALAIDNGTNLPDAPIVDFDNLLRNVGQIDIGAYEYGASIVGNTEELKNIYNYTIYQNYPNPFNSSSVIEYSVPCMSEVLIIIFNTLGQEIKTLVDEEKPAGSYKLTWNATNLPSGVYFYTIQAGSFTETKKMILMK